MADGVKAESASCALPCGRVDSRLCSHETALLLALQVLCCNDDLGPVLPALSGLSRLQLRSLDSPAFPAPVLPGGPWLASLRWLSASIDALVSSTAALQQAAALETLSAAHCAQQCVNWASPEAAAFFDWLASHPSVRDLSLEAGECSGWLNCPNFLLQFAQLWRRRPALQLQCPGSEGKGESLVDHIDLIYPF